MSTLLWSLGAIAAAALFAVTSAWSFAVLCVVAIGAAALTQGERT